MNLPQATAAIDSATAILKADNDEAALIAKVRWNEQLVNRAPAGSRRHCANIRLCDALAELDAFRARRDDPQGFPYPFYKGDL